MSVILARCELGTLPLGGYVPSLQDAPHYMEYDVFPNRADGFAAERAAIRSRNPKHNKPIGGRVARRAAA